MPRRPLSIRWWLTSLVVGVAVPLMMLLAYLLIDQVRTERMEAGNASIDQPVREAFARGLVGSTVILIVLVGAAMIMSRAIVRPVGALGLAATSVANGVYGQVQVA